jgi:hypothetical protein
MVGSRTRVARLEFLGAREIRPGRRDEVQIIVRESADQHSELRVQGVHIDSNLLTSKRGVNAALTAEWTDKILKWSESE